MIKVGKLFCIVVLFFTQTPLAYSSTQRISENTKGACNAIESIDRKSQQSLSDIKKLLEKSNAKERVRVQCREFKRNLNHLTLYAHSDLKVFSQDHCDIDSSNDTPKKFASDRLTELKQQFGEICL